MNNVEQWIDKAQETYDIDIKETLGDNQFITRTLHFSDPHGISLSFDIAFNSDNQPSLFNTYVFRFRGFNIAESFTAEDFIDAAETILSGRAALEEVGWFNKKMRLVFGRGRHAVGGNAKQDQVPELWLKNNTIPGYKRIT